MNAVLSGRSRAAIAALVYMMADDEVKTHSLHHIADEVGVSLSYLEQIFSKLRAAQIVSSVRGPGGGYQFHRSPKKLSVADVVESLSPEAQKNGFQDFICSHLQAIKLEQLANFGDEIF